MIHLQTTIIIHYHPLSSQKHKKKQGNGWERRKEPPCRFRCCPMLWHCQVWQLDLPKGSWIQQLTTRRVQKATPVSTLGASFLFVTSIPWLKFAQKAPTKKRQKQNRQWLLDPHNPLLSLILQNSSPRVLLWNASIAVLVEAVPQLLELLLGPGLAKWWNKGWFQGENHGNSYYELYRFYWEHYRTKWGISQPTKFEDGG